MDADDYFQIQNLVFEYARLLDSGEIEGLGRLFAFAEVHFQGRSTPVRQDPATVTGMFREWLQLYDGKPRTRHMMSNLQIVPDGPGKARGTCYVMVFQQTDALRLQPIIGGDYLDRFEKVNGAWRFSERVIRNDLFGDLSAHGRYEFKPV